jgi:hypothetical protein
MKNKLISATLKSATAYIILMTIVIIVADLFAPLKDFLKSVTGHHWTAKGLLGFIFFVVLATVLNFTTQDDDVSKNISWTIGATVLGTVAISVFYMLHY